MLNLIRLEFKKFNIKKIIKSTFIANIVLLGLLYFMVTVARIEKDEIFQNYNNLFMMMTSLIKATFSVFAAVIISKLIIEEYKDKTIYMLFTYPISRKKLIISKLALIVIFTFVSIIVSFIFMFTIFYITQAIFPMLEQKLTINMILNNFMNLIISDVNVSFMSLIPLYFGFRKKSVKVTILSSLILVAFVNSNSNGFSLSSILSVQIILALLGILGTYLTIKDIEVKDVIV